MHYQFLDEGFSGRTVDRPEFQLMLERAKNGCFDVLVVWTKDRLSRSLMDLFNTKKTLSECGVALISVAEKVEASTANERSHESK